MDERKVSPGLVLLAVPLLAFLLAPVLITIPISFSADPYLSFPPSGWSLRWYRAGGRSRPRQHHLEGPRPRPQGVLG